MKNFNTGSELWSSLRIWHVISSWVSTLYVTPFPWCEATSPGAGSFFGESLYSFNFHPLTAVVKSSLANSNTTICVTRRLRPRTSCILIILAIAGGLWYPQEWQSATCEVTGHKSRLNFRHQWIPTESALVYWRFSRLCIHDRPFSEVEVATALLSKRHLGGHMISYVDHWYATFGLESKVGAGEGGGGEEVGVSVERDSEEDAGSRWHRVLENWQSWGNVEDQGLINNLGSTMPESK